VVGNVRAFEEVGDRADRPSPSQLVGEQLARAVAPAGYHARSGDADTAGALLTCFLTVRLLVLKTGWMFSWHRPLACVHAGTGRGPCHEKLHHNPQFKQQHVRLRIPIS